MWRFMSNLSNFSVDIGHLGVFLFLTFKTPRNTKTGLEKDIPFLVIDRSDRYLAWRPVDVNLIAYINTESLYL